jgi:hypothetical protein
MTLSCSRSSRVCSGVAGSAGIQPQKRRVVTLQAEVEQIRKRRVRLAALAPRDHRPAEIDGVPELVDHDLDPAAHRHFLRTQIRRHGAVHRVGRRLQRPYDVVDDGGVDERLVALDVDDDVEASAQGLVRRRAALRAVGKVAGRHHHLRARGFARVADAGIVRRDDEARQRRRAPGLAPRANDHRHAGDGDQGLAGETDRGVPRGNDAELRRRGRGEEEA